MRRRAGFYLLVAAVAGALAAGAWYGLSRPRGGETAMEHALKQVDPPLASAAPQRGRRIVFYRHPMDSGVTSPTPQKDSMGMDFIPVYADEAEGEPGITVAPEVVNNLGVRTAKVERGTLARGIDTVGYLDYNESLIGHVHLRTEGWVQRLTVNTVGDRVEGGQLLFTLYSPTLVNAQEEYVQALERGNERLINASRQKLAALGISAAQAETLARTRKVERTISIFAHHPGVVTALNVREGMYVEPATEIMSVVDLSNIWLLAEVFERHAAWVEIGQQGEARVPAMPGRTWTGVVDYIYPSLNPVTRTLKVRLKFDNPGELLKPNMFAHVGILASPRSDVLTVPRDAVIRDGVAERVVLALGAGHFAPRDVVTGIESGERVEVLEGLVEGEEVVISAQFLLDSEASLKASFRRMESGPTSADPARTEDAP